MSETQTAEVSTRPEFLLPPLPLESVQREKHENVEPARVSRWAIPDDVEILPARGQYRTRT